MPSSSKIPQPEKHHSKRSWKQPNSWPAANPELHKLWLFALCFCVKKYPKEKEEFMESVTLTRDNIPRSCGYLTLPLVIKKKKIQVLLDSATWDLWLYLIYQFLKCILSHILGMTMWKISWKSNTKQHLPLLFSKLCFPNPVFQTLFFKPYFPSSIFQTLFSQTHSIKIRRL